jgi:hypothetical protein
VIPVYRVQDDDGRGPWRPGLSRYWIDEASDFAARPLETAVDLLRRAGVTLAPGWHYGCACRSMEALLRWFTEVELGRLSRMGFALVRLDADRVVVESELQVVFARRRPLRVGVTVLPWPSL